MELKIRTVLQFLHILAERQIKKSAVTTTTIAMGLLGERSSSNSRRRGVADIEAGEGSYSDFHHRRRRELSLDEQLQQPHPAPAPYPASAPSSRHAPTVTHLHQEPYTARPTTSSISAQGDTLRRRSVVTSSGKGGTGGDIMNDSSNRSNLNDSSRAYDDDSDNSESSFRFTGLEMPSTNNELDTASEHRRAARYYKPSNANQRLNASMSNIAGGLDLEEGMDRGRQIPWRASCQTRTRRSSRSKQRKKQSAPNRYYIANKNVQITSEWSSPTRQRRSRNSVASSSGRTGEKNDKILILPSISVPNGADDYNPHMHPSTVKPPSFPVRKTCVQASNILCTVRTFKWCILIQLIVVIPLCLYVFDAHAQKRSAKQQLQQYNEEHEHILNQMMWMDQAAKKMKAAHGGAKHGELLESYYAEDGATDELRESVHKLRGQMRDMQYRIQQNSKARITEKYGEGPVRVYVHPEIVVDDPLADPNGPKPEEMTKEIAIELFVEDTPHAVSTWLYQIERGHWNRVQMNWRGETTILSKPGASVTSSMGDWAQTSRLEFLEKFPVKHCEVALVQEGQMGTLSLKINLVEVPLFEQEEVCIGRLINDKMVLPQTHDYLMASFSTTPIVTEQPEKKTAVKEEATASRKKTRSEGQQIVPPLEEPEEGL